MMMAEGSHVVEAPPTQPGPQLSRPLPLNSKRLTGAVLRQIARGLGVPGTASADEVRQVVEGKLGELGRDPRNTQVCWVEVEEGLKVTLKDADGVFLEVEPEENGAQEEVEEEQVNVEAGDVDALRQELEEAKAAQLSLEAELTTLRQKYEREKAKAKDLWSVNCAQLAEFDETLLEKEEEIAQLKDQLAAAKRTGGRHRAPQGSGGMGSESEEETRSTTSGSVKLPSRRGKAPPVQMFSGEDPEVRLNDWLPSLQRASQWNGWEQEERLIQLAGHLKGRALQEWNLLEEAQKDSYDEAVKSLRGRLDTGSKAMAAQDFRHLAQEGKEKVTDFICRLEKTFRLAYGQESMSTETRDALLYGQLQEGLGYVLMESPAVSGATGYQSLCVAAKNEERRQAALKKRKQYQSTAGGGGPAPSKIDAKLPGGGGMLAPERRGPPTRRCWNCDTIGHLAKDCRRPKRESFGSASSQKTPHTRMVRSGNSDMGPPASDGASVPPSVEDDPLRYLLSDSEEEAGVNQVRVTDKGSAHQQAMVLVAGVPLFGVVDTGADVTIMGGSAFKQVAAAARLHKRDFKPANKAAHNYDRKPFRLDGRLDLDVSFADHTMKTAVFVKMDAPEPLLLSEGVCRQLGIVVYHPEVKPRGKTSGLDTKTQVSAVRVQLVESVKLLPGPDRCVMAEVELSGNGVTGTLLLEPDPQFKREQGVVVPDALVSPPSEGTTRVVLTNQSGFTQRLEAGTTLGTLEAVDWEGEVERQNDMVAAGVEGCCGDESSEDASVKVWMVGSEGVGDGLDRKHKLREVLKGQIVGSVLSVEEKEELCGMLLEFDDVFSVEDGERGETDLVEFSIDTGDAGPKRQPPRRVPFAVRQEIARHLREMQDRGVIQPSSSPWASPVVLVRKKDGTMRFCVDYRGLNALTKPDKFPLPRIDDLLDQLGKSQYFTTLDLASGYWQIRVEERSREKTAFVTHEGLYEFLVMPFGLTNAPAVFQRLIQRVLSGLNPGEFKRFVEAYIDDIIVFSETLPQHLCHLRLVLERLRGAYLKLKTKKCHFIRQEVEYLGHLITPLGLRPNPSHIAAVVDYPVPESITQVRQFLGLTSYYRRFVSHFAKLASPLHQLTKKDVTVVFEWTEECQHGFETLKSKLTEAPILAYPDFELSFVLETDACVAGLGAVLSQHFSDGYLHPVAFASRALSAPEKNYSITELETLAVVWSIQHFRAYLYGHEVTVITDHSAVRSILETPNPSGKHARWWLKVYGSGVGQVRIVYRPGKENMRADALSRNPIRVEGEQPLELGMQVAQVSSRQLAGDITHLLDAEPVNGMVDCFASEQRKDASLGRLCDYLESGVLPRDAGEARKVVSQALSFAVVNGTLYFVDAKRGNRKRVAVPAHLHEQILQEGHRGALAGHFSGPKLFNGLCRHWWWPTLYKDAVEFCKNCAECAVVSGVGRKAVPPLNPIPVQRPFQILGVDIMELPMTATGNRYVVVFQDFLTKWPFIFPAPDQKAIRIARLLAEEVVPMFGVPEALLSDRGTNLLAHVMLDVCGLLGITKLNTTAYHPQCNGMVERLNRTLKAMLRKHVARFGTQWDRYLPGVLWAYRNSPHEATGEKPSFLLFGVDCRSPTEAALMPPTPLELTDVADYREELVLSLSSARKLAAAHIRTAQNRCKAVYDRRVRGRQHQVGDWVLLRFPQEESGRQRKLSRPWHGPYRVVEKRDPDITAVKVYFPEKGPIQVHQSRACPCPPKLPAGFYWYGGTCKSPGKVPAWVGRLLEEGRSLEQDAATGGTEDAAEDTDTDVEDLGPTADVEDGDTAVEEPDVDCDVMEAMEGPVEQIPEPPRRSTCTRYPLRAAVCPPDRY